MQKYRDDELVSAKVSATEIALEMDIDPELKAARRIKRDEKQNEYTRNAEQAFVIDYFSCRGSGSRCSKDTFYGNAGVWENVWISF